MAKEMGIALRGRCKEEEKEARRSGTKNRRAHGRRRRRGGGPGGGGAAWRQVGGDAGGIGRGPVEEEEGPGKVGEEGRGSACSWTLSFCSCWGRAGPRTSGAVRRLGKATALVWIVGRLVAKLDLLARRKFWPVGCKGAGYRMLLVVVDG
jgi:hypothetical protein